MEKIRLVVIDGDFPYTCYLPKLEKGQAKSELVGEDVVITLFSYMGFTLTDGVAFLLILELLERWSADAERVLCSTHQPVQQTHTWRIELLLCCDIRQL